MKTPAWVLYRAGTDGSPSDAPGQLRLEEISLPELGERDVLAEPLYGSWEANMTHALERSPVDVVAARGEDRVVLGNSGVVRVLRTGPAATGVREGDVCFLVCGSKVDRRGYVEQIHAYDAPGTMGVLAKRTVVPDRVLTPLPPGSRHDLRRWAACARYWSAWSNWRLAYRTWRLEALEDEVPCVLAWGGGVSLAQCELAQIKDGARAAMVASTPGRLALLRSKGLHAIDRTSFRDLHFDEERFRADAAYRAAYRAAEHLFLGLVESFTQGQGASIVIDNIGTPVYRASLKALARGGVLTTCGWKHGMAMKSYRAIACIQRHQYIHTHAAGLRELDDIVAFQERHGWLPQVATVTPWEQIGELATAYGTGGVDDYFPVFEVSPA